MDIFEAIYNQYVIPPDGMDITKQQIMDAIHKAFVVGRQSPTSTVTPVFDGSRLKCSGCNHRIGYRTHSEGPDEYYGPRCPGCGKLIDREGK